MEMDIYKEYDMLHHMAITLVSNGGRPNTKILQFGETLVYK
jgi:hypothetical protein